MKGAYCLDCLELGPDLVLTPDTVEIPIGTSITVGFTCDRCRLRWVWIATRTETGFVYSRPDVPS